MQVHLVDGTYELFRYFFAVPSHLTDDGREVGAARAVVGSMLRMLEEGVTHLGVATDHVIESFRNDMWPGYKDGSGVDPALKSQFGLLEDALEAAGICVMAMVEVEADDALGAMAKVAAADERVDEVVICTPDKDLGQCVGGKVVQLDRRKGGTRYDAEAVKAKFGVAPESIPDYLALVGDSADGFPGLQGWGSKSAAAVLAVHLHIDAIPDSVADWGVNVRNSPALAARLVADRKQALLFRRLATLNTDCEVGSVDDWRWTGPSEAFAAMCDRLDAPDLLRRAEAVADRAGN
jgi:5'-3' exonuclease